MNAATDAAWGSDRRREAAALGGTPPRSTPPPPIRSGAPCAHVGSLVRIEGVADRRRRVSQELCWGVVGPALRATSAVVPSLFASDTAAGKPRPLAAAVRLTAASIFDVEAARETRRISVRIRLVHRRLRVDTPRAAVQPHTPPATISGATRCLPFHCPTQRLATAELAS